MPTIYIDNKPYEVKAGKNLLETCLTLGLDLPYFCWHPALGSVGACRQCAITLFKDKEDTQGRIVMSCMEPVKEGACISVSNATAKAFRGQVIEWLMTNHPHDCPVCDEGGCCHLQDMTVMTGHNYRRYQYKKRTYLNQYLGPLLNHEMNRCIQCYRCVRFYKDYAGGEDLNVFAAHHHVYFGREKDGILQSPFSGNLVEVCPTGVFTDKTLKQHYTRKWDLTAAPSVCQHCSLGCNTTAGERYGKIRSITNRYNGAVNGYFLCDRGRFGYEFVNDENRITQPLIRNRVPEAVDEQSLMDHLKLLLTQSRTLIGIGSSRASVESNFALRQLVGSENFYQGVSLDEAALGKLIASILQSGAVHTPSLKEMEQADAVLVLGEDIWNTAPIMALSVRQAVMNSAAANALQQTSIAGWHDAAVRELVQDNKGFLANAGLTASPLDDISTCTLHATPHDIAVMGFAIAHAIHPGLPEVPQLNNELAAKAAQIAKALQQAKRPLIISGPSCYNEAMIKAAFDIAGALNTGERKAMLSYVLPACNSMTLAMMQAPSFEKSIDRINDNTVVIILEQDLYRSIPPAKANAFFNRCKNLIVLDSLHNGTTEKAQVLIPAATMAEADGTLINNEGRAQRYYQVFVPTTGMVKESWKWFWQMRSLQTSSGNGLELHPNDWLTKLEKTLPQFNGISRVSYPPEFRIHGQAIPREPHRYSGRTAMLANLAVSEPKPLQDNDSPLSFTMEGYPNRPPASLIPFFWAPGWNSIQSVNKYQQETGGALSGGDPGIRLLEQKTGTPTAYFTDIPEALPAPRNKWLLLPAYHIFGSDELSAYSAAIRELCPEPYIGLSTQDTAELGITDGKNITLVAEGEEYTYPLKIQEHLCNGIVLLPAGLPGMPALTWGSWATIAPSLKNNAV
ncbi:NADH-quinone oxidoreductase subunit NuoG [Paraflavitalea sp. CAU 1676]|uniref:NADH-quinone oxidoreductase subunit NuoG n=1 Tax=Paraflavitalea sp. CAU 1676 TaxID=3032598 RepID=UPI0023DB4D5E|nr:NADH-quinone oxidoreductase subunit NuoG [Paraflavitalea sp. CAU 1676]MDF2189085.1 NADH-quinone oxidoreductase subunit NuoG [Paraflavitalea sp. CAU 1676]